MKQRPKTLGCGLILMTAFLVLQGCSSLSYYSQSIGGHLQLMGQRRPIVAVLQDPETPDSLKQQLAAIKQIRDFASDSLALPDNDSYRSYADLERDAVVWSVVAAPQFSMQPKQWCYLVIGCASYRGYFSRQSADLYADELRAQGLDVAVEPVPAYSTLGWFDDPLPSTIVGWSSPRIAGLIFHELAHQQLYVKDDSAFNEAFAGFVEEVGVVKWLEDQDAQRLEQWQRSQQREQQFIGLLLETRKQLQVLFDQAWTPDQMQQRKATLYQSLRERYESLKKTWEGYSGFDGWFDRDLNNAHLVSIATYEQWKPALKQLLIEADGQLPAFYQACRSLGLLSEEERRKRLIVLMAL
ncbi:aminopeptidase [Sedimenticola selenatireducens]|uniref:Aminopeptidase n=1 Tax=Sedimenticola selenatireducens TaxID=191960 RepID=A0A558DNS2_9GAMM|nr:aminopeptidase [Sedimenticola selenatireducens]TVO78475.1 aminopeptidase [Sedimenticola selenatireducens]TVT62666.1 MAG: aminopeptidase [Sedimenticola selenatireducens]